MSENRGNDKGKSDIVNGLTPRPLEPTRGMTLDDV
jgi:hypothetical protein